MTPNVLFTKTWGKFLFAVCDIVIGILLYNILELLPLPSSSSSPATKDRIKKKEDKKMSKNMQSSFSIIRWVLDFIESKEGRNLMLTCVWLFNPFAIVVSTRGNAESIIGVLVLASIYLIFTNHLFWGAVMYCYSPSLSLLFPPPPPYLSLARSLRTHSRLLSSSLCS